MLAWQGCFPGQKVNVAQGTLFPLSLHSGAGSGESSITGKPHSLPLMWDVFPRIRTCSALRTNKGLLLWPFRRLRLVHYNKQCNTDQQRTKLLPHSKSRFMTQVRVTLLSNCELQLPKGQRAGSWSRGSPWLAEGDELSPTPESSLLPWVPAWALP